MDLTLKQLRLMRGLTQVETAKRLNTNQQTYCAWEQLDDKKLEEIAKVLNSDCVSKTKFSINDNHIDG